MSDDKFREAVAVVDLVALARIAELEAENAQLREIVSQLEAVNEGWRKDVARLRDRWERLKAWLMEGEALEPTDAGKWLLSGVRGQMLEAERPEGEKPFKCPKCGSPYFGRVGDEVHCNGSSSGPKIYGDHRGMCDWRGVWPQDGEK